MYPLQNALSFTEAHYRLTSSPLYPAAEVSVFTSVTNVQNVQIQISWCDRRQQ